MEILPSPLPREGERDGKILAGSCSSQEEKREDRKRRGKRWGGEIKNREEEEEDTSVPTLATLLPLLISGIAARFPLRKRDHNSKSVERN